MSEPYSARPARRYRVVVEMEGQARTFEFQACSYEHAIFLAGFKAACPWYRDPSPAVELVTVFTHASEGPE